MKTVFPDVGKLSATRVWHLLDAKDKVLGRLASKAAVLLMGKHKPTWSPHLDCGDFVVVTNAAQIRLTGKKILQKQYFSHSGYPDGMKITPVKKLLSDHPERVMEFAVKRMLPKTSLGRLMMRRLKIYAGDKHPHGNHKPQNNN
ncbi:MAG: 50S ribosomal protein L13 [Elusimicrobia bacterium]|nr:50S ribosomal protein L13 [Elusimicrobiota bacterium]